LNFTGRVLITGVTGFIGSAVARHFVRQSDYFVRGMARRTLPELPEKVEQMVGDLSHQADWSSALQGIDIVVHAAGHVHVMEQSSPHSLENFRKINVEGTLNLARQAAQARVSRFIFLSTVKVNGENTLPGQQYHPDEQPAPQDPYAISKYEAELKLRELAAETGMELVVIRPPLVYGPGVKGNFASLINWVQKGVPLPLGMIDNRRSLLALDNLVSFIALCSVPSKSPLAANQVFLVSDGEDESTPNLIRKVAVAYGKRARLVPVPMLLLRWGARMFGKGAAADRLLGSLQVDSTKTSDLLGWRPGVTMEEQLRKMVEHDKNV